MDDPSTTRRPIDQTSGHEAPSGGISIRDDLAPLVFNRVTWQGRILEIEPPLTLTPRWDEESGQLLVLIDNELGIDVFAPSRAEVVEELAEQLLFSWDTYARERPERLSLGAQRLRTSLLARIREIDLAAQP